MIDALLSYYQKELKKIRSEAADFGAAHPTLAKNLKLSPGVIEDPMVGRLLEGFSFLTAHLHQRLDHQFDRLNQSLLDLICPYLSRLIPSMTIFKCHPDKRSCAIKTLPKGLKVSSRLKKNEVCHFKISQAVDVIPVAITVIRLSRAGLQSSLSLKLKTFKPSITIDQLGIKKLRFFISHSLSEAYDFHEMLLTEVMSIQFQSIANSHLKKLCLSSCLKKVDFEDSLLPSDRLGYSMLRELAVFPQKFLFFDLACPVDMAPEWGDELEIQILFRSFNPMLEKSIDQDSLCLSCVPAINVFEQIAEPIRLDQTKTEYRIVPDANQRPGLVEVYEVQSVELFSDQHTKTLPCYPMFGRKFSDAPDSYFYWHASRKSGWEVSLPHLIGAETFLSFSSEGCRQEEGESITVVPKLWCTNRDCSRLLSNDAVFVAAGYEDSVESIRPIVPITEPRYEWLNSAEAFLFLDIKFQKFNWLDEASSLEMLKELLSMMGFGVDVLSGLVSLKCKKIMKRHSSSWQQGFCFGLEMRLGIDSERSAGLVNSRGLTAGSISYLLGLVLEDFFSRGAPINSFVEFLVDRK